MKLWFKGTNSDCDIWIDSIIFNLSDGLRSLKVNRTQTKYTVVNKEFEMVWTGCYAEYKGLVKGKEQTVHNHAITPAMFKDAEIALINLREDAPEKYDLHISEWEARN